MYDITIEKVNHAEVRLRCTDTSIYDDLHNYLSFYKDKYWFSPKYRNGVWDGKIKFYKKGVCPIGFVPRILEYARDGKYRVKMNFEVERELDEDRLLEFIDNLPKPFEPRDFQVEGFFDALSKRNMVVISKTGTGKSFLIYLLIQYMKRVNKKVLLLVSRLGLIEQMYSDLEEYGLEDMRDNVRQVYSGIKKEFPEQLIISTWQSIYKLKEKDIDVFDCVIVDEAHEADGKSISNILGKLKKAEYRIGTTGTIVKDTSADYFTVVGYLGVPKLYRTYEELREQDILSPIQVNIQYLNYPEHLRQMASSEFYKNYKAEVDYICGSDVRNNYIIKLVREKCEKNTLILFQYIEKHGKVLLELFKQRFPDRKIVYIDGGVPKEKREEARRIIEENDNVIILASYGTFSVGINAPNIHNIIFASSTKSFIRTAQSIGRGLRLHKNKDMLFVYDLVDNFSYPSGSYENYLLEHYKERMKLYESENFPIEKYDVNL